MVTKNSKPKYQLLPEPSAVPGAAQHREAQVAEVTRLKTGALAETKASKAAASIHAADKGAEIAERIKDASALEKALLAKLQWQRDFAAEYKAKFPHGGDREQVDRTVHLPREQWCLSYGFHEKTVRRWCGLLSEDELSAKNSAVLKRCWELAELWQAANYSSASVEWYTPARYLEAVRQVLGQIDLDPASNLQANEVVRASNIYTKDDDGLAKSWSGRVFVNPPYGKTAEGASLAAAFCMKAIEEYENGNVKACIILVNSSHSQTWQAPLYSYPVCLVDHRIQFVSGDGEENKNPTFQNIFIYLGNERARFATVFSRIGYVMRKIEGEKSPTRLGAGPRARKYKHPKHKLQRNKLQAQPREVDHESASK